MEDTTLSESILARGWTDTKRIVGGVWFWALEVTAAGIALFIQNGWLAIWIVLAIFMLLLIGAIATAPVRQRNEARAIARRLSSTWITVEGVKVKSMSARSKLTNAPIPAKYIHLTVAAPHKTVRNCEVRLKTIQRITDPMETADYDGTIFLVTQQVWERSVDLHPDMPVNFDVLQCNSANNKLWFSPGEPPEQVIPITLESFFDPRAVYLLEYFLTSDDSELPLTGHIKIDWTGGFNELGAELVHEVGSHAE